MSQWLLVRLARTLYEARKETLIHDGSSFDHGVHAAMDRTIEYVANALLEAGHGVSPTTFKLNAGHSSVTSYPE